MKTPPFFERYSFARRERFAIIIIAILSIFFSLLPGLFRLIRGEPNQVAKTDDTSWMDNVKEVKNSENQAINKFTYGNTDASVTNPVYSFFDPNTASLQEFEQLGLKTRVAQTIINFRTKGGKFRHPEDLKRIYGLTLDEYNKLKPWIKIAHEEPSEKQQHASFSEESPHPSFKKNFSDTFHQKKFYPKTENPIIDINQANEEQWQALRGIGPGYSRRIVNFREKLGGFYNIDQLGETYGLPDSVFESIKPFLQLSPLLRQIDLNSASVEELKNHPYLNYQEAKLLFNYVQQHAPVKDKEQLKKAMLKIFTTERWEKIEPYLNLHN